MHHQSYRSQIKDHIDATTRLKEFMDMERHHLQTIQHLHLELAEARGRSGQYKYGSQTTHDNSIDSYVENKGNLINTSDNRSNGTLAHGSSENLTSCSIKVGRHATGLIIVISICCYTLQVQDQDTSFLIQKSEQQIVISSQPLSASAVAASAVGLKPATESGISLSVHSEVSDLTTRELSSMVATMALNSPLLDERALLACLVRAVPTGPDCEYRTIFTCPNRLGKMLAPPHWHDYKKCYGKLDKFVAHHLELFVIEGDFIHLRERDQEIISAVGKKLLLLLRLLQIPHCFPPLLSLQSLRAISIRRQREGQNERSRPLTESYLTLFRGCLM
ncbi:hypothetical protein AXF42_Ash013194 [Apostasia shenzhenica]|uniref:DUF7725 domain-containing protein n=1 Tax=Apostasia shenzhenica TaxID=1088818 RepID=A0A2I0BDA5_9ASPA|nr:hypothetical protein AXF42_Ash013194 [Apostasia shenzhenica]